jgi:outer membrane protein
MPGRLLTLRFNIDSTRTYALAELIDLAESHNPATRVDWERARAQAEALGVTRSELFPTLASAVVSQTARQQAFFGNRFNGQEIQDFQVQMDLNYTVFDFGARSGRITKRKHSSWRPISLSMTLTARSSTMCSSLTTGY